MANKRREENVHSIKSKDDFDAAIKEDKLLVLNCFATWFSNTYKTVKFYQLDIDEVSDVAQELDIRAVPTFLLYKNGIKVDDVIGAKAEELENAIKSKLEGGEKAE